MIGILEPGLSQGYQAIGSRNLVLGLKIGLTQKKAYSSQLLIWPIPSNPRRLASQPNPALHGTYARRRRL